MTFAIEWGEHGPRIVPHFCREWDGDRGCYGTNPDHGYSWEEARAEMVNWYAAQANHWRNRAEAEEFPPMDDVEVAE